MHAARRWFNVFNSLSEATGPELALSRNMRKPSQNTAWHGLLSFFVFFERLDRQISMEALTYTTQNNSDWFRPFAFFTFTMGDDPTWLLLKFAETNQEPCERELLSTVHLELTLAVPLQSSVSHGFEVDHSRAWPSTCWAWMPQIFLYRNGWPVIHTLAPFATKHSLI